MENKEETLWRIAKLQTDTIERQQTELHDKERYIKELEERLVTLEADNKKLTEVNHTQAETIVEYYTKAVELEETNRNLLGNIEALKADKEKEKPNDNPLYYHGKRRA